MEGECDQHLFSRARELQHHHRETGLQSYLDDRSTKISFYCMRVLEVEDYAKGSVSRRRKTGRSRLVTSLRFFFVRCRARLSEAKAGIRRSHYISRRRTLKTRMPACRREMPMRADWLDESFAKCFVMTFDDSKIRSSKFSLKTNVTASNSKSVAVVLQIFFKYQARLRLVCFANIYQRAAVPGDEAKGGVRTRSYAMRMARRLSLSTPQPLHKHSILLSPASTHPRNYHENS